MADMPMCGAWTSSLAQMRMPGPAALGAVASFLGMWTVMMAAMMLPSLAPWLWRYRAALARAGETRPGRLAALAGAGYFAVWSLVGIAVYPLTIAIAALEQRPPAAGRAAPIVIGVVVLIAGVFQFTAWKAHQLACCRQLPGHGPGLAMPARTAWRYGLRLGQHCCCCSAGLTAILLVAGVMDLRVMGLVTLATTVERLTSYGQGAARAIGVVALAAGVLLIA